MSGRFGIAVALALLGACKHGSKQPPPIAHDAAPPAHDAAPSGPLTIEPQKTYALPPVEAGYTRNDYYDVEYKTGDCKPSLSAVRESSGPFALVVAQEVVLERTVGTLRMTCSGAASEQPCLAAACATLRAVPGGSAEEAYPTEAAVVAVSSSGGFTGQVTSGADVFADGTVRYHGPTCPRWRGRRGQLTPAARDALFAAITASGIAQLHESTRDEAKRLAECADDIYESIGWDGIVRTLGCHPVPELDAAMAALEAAVFPNPCN